MKSLRWDGLFLHCTTGSLRKHKPSVPCSILLSNNYVIIKPCRRNIKGSTNLAYSKNVTLEVPVRLSFQSLPLFLGNEKSTKCTYFATGCCFIHPSLIFATQSLIMSLQHIMLCISLLHGHSVLPKVMKDPLSIVILQIWPTKILSILRHQNSDFYVAYF